MTRIRLLALIVPGIVGLVAVQGGAQAPVDGNSRLAGRVVVDDAQHAPIRGAIVTINSGYGRARSTITDDGGAFDFHGLPPGRYAITASKSPFVPMAFGAKRPDRPGIPVSMASGQAFVDLVIALPRGAVVTGTLRDQNAAPLADITVTAIRMDRADGQASFAGNTDDRGVFRIFGLPPGKYLVAATFRVTGLGGDIGAPSTADVDRLFAELRRPANARSAASQPVAATPPASMPVAGYAPTFFSGTVSPADAEIITLSSGELRAVDFVIAPVPTGSVEGTIVMHDGSPMPVVNPSLGPIGPALPVTFGMNPTLSIRPGPDGHFKFTGVLPGKYSLTASPTPGRGASVGPPLWASTELTSQGTDITGVVLTLRPGVHLSGRLAFDGSAPPPADMTKLMVALKSTTTVSGAFFFGGGQMSLGATANARADGTFDIGDVVPAPYTVIPSNSGPWTLRSAILNGRDLLDAPFEIGRDGDVEGAVLTFSDRHTELSGTLQSPANTPATDYFVVVFPADATMWLPGARRIQSVRPATDGRFTIRNLPGGDYLLCAVGDVGPEDLADPDFFRQLLPAGLKFTLADGETKIQNLRIAGKQPRP